ncbi:Importin subunit alpha-7 [Mortierella sp. AD011]|nr:Importin subunit alpha-7 [Mortierella sp. AD011]
MNLMWNSVSKNGRRTSPSVATLRALLRLIQRTREYLLSIVSMIQGVMSENTEELLGAITSFSKLLPNVRNSLIDEVIRYEVVPRFIEFLRSPHTVEQVAAWALTNIASGTYAQTQYVIEAGAILVFVELLNSPVDDVKEQAAWVLENVAGDSPRCRDIVLCENASAPLLTLLYENINLTMLRNATWTISNFCRGKNPPPD